MFRVSPVNWRAVALTFVYASSAAMGLATPSDAADKLTMRLDWTPQGMYAPIFLAQQKGWFRKAGLDVAIEDGNGSIVTVQLVGSRQFDVGHASLSSVAIARGKGVPVISIAGFVRKSDMGVLVPAGSHWRTAKDLEGKKIAYTAGSLEGPFIDAFFGASRSKVDLLNVDAATKVGVYLSGNADGVISTVPYVLPIVAAKRPSEGILFAESGLNLPGFGLFTTNAALSEKRDALKRLVSVITGAWEYVLDGHEDEAVTAIIKAHPQLPLDAAILRSEVDNYKAYFYTDPTRNMPFGFQSEFDWDKTIKVMESADVIPKGSKPSDYFTNDLIDPTYFKTLVK
jgi:NitT/TauT family transport system substrate-binding protein